MVQEMIVCFKKSAFKIWRRRMSMITALLSSRGEVMSVIIGITLLFITGCGYHPDLLYVGSDAILEYPFVRSAAASTDYPICLLYTSDAADERSSVDLGGRRIIK